MKTCCAGHDTVEFSVSRCPACAVIDRLDKKLLLADVRIAELEKQVVKLTNEKVSSLKENWNGGTC